MGDSSVTIQCTECGDRAQKMFSGKMYCSDCHDDLIPLDFEQ